MPSLASHASQGSLQQVEPRASSSVQTVGSSQVFFWTLACVVLLRILYVISADIDNIIYRLTDDSYYYFNTARNIVLGFGVSFDRINPTNGFHPLWMVLLLPIYALAGSDGETPLRVISIMMALLAGASVWVAYRVVCDWLGRQAALFTAVLMFHPLVMNYFLNGLETGLFLLLTLTVVRVDQQWRLTSEESSFSRSVVWGALLGAMFLSRLDSIFLIFTVFVAWLLRCLQSSQRSEIPQRILHLLTAGGVFTVLGCLYFAWNYRTFGHLMPISGALKSSFPHVMLSFEPLSSINGCFHLLGVVGFWGLWMWLLVSRHSTMRQLLALESGGKVPSLFAPLWFGATGQFFYELLFTKWGAQWWHFAAQVVPVLLLGAVVFTLVVQWSKKPIATPLLAGMSLFALSFALLEVRVRGAHHEPWWNAIAWVKEHTPPDAVFAMTDSGFFGYFSDRRTVNLDGVINGYAFQEALRDGKTADFLRTAGVQYVVDYEVPSVGRAPREDATKAQRAAGERPVNLEHVSMPHAATAESSSFQTTLHKIRLKDRLFPGGRRTDILTAPQAEVYRSAPYADYVRITRKGGSVSFVIWRFDQLALLDAAS